MNDKHLAAFLDRLDPKPSGCWEWLGNRDHGGYSKVGRHFSAHRLSYEHFVGPIPEGLQIDHLCRNRACVNPDHLEPVTCKENLMRGETRAGQRARQTHCIHGHAFDESNTYINRNGWRQCRACLDERQRARREAVALAKGPEFYASHVRRAAAARAVWQRRR